MTASTTNPATPVTAATTGHVGLNVTDLARSIDFYRQVFGFDVLGEGTEEGCRYVFLGRGDHLVLTLWPQSSAAFATDRPGLHHLAFNVPTLADVHAAVERLRTLGVPLIYDRVLPHLPGAASGGIFFTDPDGIRVEICTASGLTDLPALDHCGPSCGFF